MLTDDAMIQALHACRNVLFQLQAAMPLEGIAQQIMAQGYTGAALSKAQAALATVQFQPSERKENIQSEVCA